MKYLLVRLTIALLSLLCGFGFHFGTILVYVAVFIITDCNNVILKAGETHDFCKTNEFSFCKGIPPSICFPSDNSMLCCAFVFSIYCHHPLQ